MSVYLSVCLLPIKTKLGTGTHDDPRSVSVKVKVIYLCVRYKEFMPATPGK